MDDCEGCRLLSYRDMIVWYINISNTGLIIKIKRRVRCKWLSKVKKVVMFFLQNLQVWDDLQLFTLCLPPKHFYINLD